MTDTTTENWKITVFGPRAMIEGALLAHEDAFDWDFDIILAGGEVAKDQPEDWKLEAYLPRKPRRADNAAIMALFAGEKPKLQAERLPDVDWVTLSQEGLEPIRAGRFCVHTPDHPADTTPGITNFCVPASCAFGTGHHETTAGCLAILTIMRREGVIAQQQHAAIPEFRGFRLPCREMRIDIGAALTGERPAPGRAADACGRA